MNTNTTSYLKRRRLLEVVVLQRVVCHLQQREYGGRHLMKSE